MRRRAVKTLAWASIVVCVSVVSGCSYLKQRRLTGQWKTEATPERTLDFYEDGTFSLRLSGKGLGFVSDLVGPEKGSWRVDGDVLVLASHDDRGVETTKRLPINSLSGDELVLAGDRWKRTK
jgi:hypothetical protein